MESDYKSGVITFFSLSTNIHKNKRKRKIYLTVPTWKTIDQVEKIKIKSIGILRIYWLLQQKIRTSPYIIHEAKYKLVLEE